MRLLFFVSFRRLSSWRVGITSPCFKTWVTSLTGWACVLCWPFTALMRFPLERLQSRVQGSRWTCPSPFGTCSWSDGSAGTPFPSTSSTLLLKISSTSTKPSNRTSSPSLLTFSISWNSNPVRLSSPLGAEGRGTGGLRPELVRISILLHSFLLMNSTN